MSWWAILVRLLVTAFMAWASFNLLRREATAPRYSAAMVGLFLMAVLWLADIEHSARIVIWVFEIDRRIELAQDVIKRLETVEDSAKKITAELQTLNVQAKSLEESAIQTTMKVEAMIAQAKDLEETTERTTKQVEATIAKAEAIEKRLLETEERQLLRIWVNILPNGEELLNPVSGGKRQQGNIRQAIGPRWSQGAPFKLGKGPKWEWTCDDKTVIQLSALINEFPYVRVHPD